MKVKLEVVPRLSRRTDWGTGWLERVTITLHTPLGRCEFTPLYPSFVRGED